MNNEMIETLYLYAAEHNDVNNAEYKKAWTEHEAITNDISDKIGSELCREIDYSLTEICGTWQRYGFIAGFKCAMRLMDECKKL